MAKAVIFLLLVTVIWGTTFPLQKIVLSGVSTDAYIAVRFWIAGLLSFAIWKKQHFKYGIILGLVFAFAYITQIYGLTMTTSSKSGFITSLYIVMTPFFSFLWEKEKPTIAQYIGFPLAAVGSYILSGNISSINIGDFLTFLCAIGFAVQIVLTTIYSKKVEETSILGWQFITVAVITTVMALTKGAANGTMISQFVMTPAAWASAIYTAVFATIFALLVQARYQKVVGSNTSALIFVGEPIFTLIFSMIILGERLTPLQWGGVAILMTALILSSLDLEKHHERIMQKLRER